jgi:hypothetical protein
MGLLDQAKTWMTPERAIGFQGLGMALSQLDAGRPVDLSPAYAALEQRKSSQQMRKVLDTPGVLDGFTPQQRAILASMPEQLAVQIIGQRAFEPAPVQEPVKYEYRTGPDGSIVALNPYDPTYQSTVVPGQQEPGYTQKTGAELAKIYGPIAGLEAGALYNVSPDNQISKVGGGGVTVENNMPGAENKYNEFSARTAAERHGTIIQEGQNATRMMGDLKAIAAIGTQIETGKLAEAKLALGPYAEAIGIDIAGMGEAQAYQAIIDRLAPQMRPAGAGATSDFDARQFLSSLPQLGNNPEGNLIINQTFDAIAQHKQAAADIALQAAMGELTWQEADRKIAALGDPYEAFNEYRKKSGVSGGEGAGSYVGKGADVIEYDANGKRKTP